MDYEALFKEALMHLRCVSGSRNSFAPDASNRLFREPLVDLRTPEVHKMHMAAVEFLHKYDR